MAYNKTTYFKLRSRLDAFEAMALSYCLNAATDEEAQERMESLFKNLPTVELQNNLNGVQANAKSASGGNNCPPEVPYMCNGHCLPYPCPTD